LKVLDLIVFKIWVSYIVFAAKSVGVCCLWIPIELVFEWLFEIAPKDEVSGGIVRLFMDEVLQANPKEGRVS